MATVEYTGAHSSAFPATGPSGPDEQQADSNDEQAPPSGEHPAPNGAARKFHRIREVRVRQGVSLRSAARQMKSDIRQLRHQEQETADLRLSELQQWQKALDVPIGELLSEQDTPLSPPVMERARMVRIMKTVAAIIEHAESASIRRMAQTLADQLTEVMPELEGVSGWHTYGQRRSSNEYGRIAEQPISDDWLRDSSES